MLRNTILIILLFLSTPLLAVSLPTGVVAYSGPIYTNQVLGYANITSLLAYNASGPKFGVPPYGASLQLNVMLQVNTSNEEYYFWLQNVADFITNESKMFFSDNIWNSTTPLAGINNLIGKGEIYSTSDLFSHSSYYAYGTYYIKYNFPFSFYLIVNESHNNQGVYVSFGYVILQNGNITLPNPTFYDTVFIPVNNLTSASIIIANQTTPNLNLGIITYLGNYLDAELVWGGFGNGASTTFLNMSSYLALLYMKNGKWVPFSQVYNYGSDTAESTNNLRVTIAKNRDAYVTIGKQNPGLLTTNFNPSIPGFLYLNISSKIPFLVNNVISRTFSGYVSAPIKLGFFMNYSINSSSFAVLNGNYPSLIEPNVSWFKILNIIPNYTYYYLVRVNSSIPVIAEINGKQITLNDTNWFVQDTQISIVNYTYHNGSDERYVISSISPSSSFDITKPLNVTINTIKQYRVVINSNLPVYLNGKRVNGGLWINADTTVKLSASIPFYEVGRFIGTYNLTPGETIVVSKPIIETLKLSFNTILLGIMALIGVIIVVMALILRKKR
ncbi:MAG: thermopsin [Saccharolobus sp.]|uniref:Thermopsin n=2 Tax=Saccharolobus TaxID=2100760 RepID=A0A8F5BQ67_SACSH|nr:thermopsin [Saccharolobus shibatae]MCH4816496.1 thermopsin [Saccharolobus shibatae]QXJ29319.1 Thermopsin [Saccharolobus shibatae B12]